MEVPRVAFQTGMGTPDPIGRAQQVETQPHLRNPGFQRHGKEKNKCEKNIK